LKEKNKQVKKSKSEKKKKTRKKKKIVCENLTGTNNIIGVTCTMLNWRFSGLC